MEHCGIDLHLKSSEVRGWTRLGWCVMATHYHLAVRVGQVPLWRSMRLIQGRFARSPPGPRERHPTAA